MNCTFSEPLVLDSLGELVTPSDDSLPFQFSKMECDLEIPEASSPATTTVILDPESSFYVGITETISTFHIFAILVLMVLGVFVANTFFKR